MAAPQPSLAAGAAEAGSTPQLWPFADASAGEPTGPTPTTGRLIVHFSIRGHPEQSSPVRGFAIDAWTDANERVYPAYDRAVGWVFTLSPGHYRLGCNGPARRCDRDVRLTAGQTLEVSIER